MEESPADRSASRRFCFRFDVDTHRCVREGVPALLDLAAGLDVGFTFFVNMGRGVSRAEALRRRLLPGDGAPPSADKLSPFRKLGPVGSAVAALLNPEVGAGHTEVLGRARDEGHELGLHGGSNHAVWQARAHGWGPDRVEREVRAGLEPLRRLLGGTPAGFSSPGWVTPEGLPAALAELGFGYLADEHGRGEGVGRAPGAPELATVHTNLTGEPGGVAYIEHLRARGLDARQILDDFVRRLGTVRSLAVAYDHPCWAGVRDLELVAAMVRTARERGFRTTTLGEAVRSHRGG